MTDQEIDVLLERFDQTGPHLQRRIIARFVEERCLAIIAIRLIIGRNTNRPWTEVPESEALAYLETARKLAGT